MYKSILYGLAVVSSVASVAVVNNVDPTGAYMHIDNKLAKRAPTTVPVVIPPGPSVCTSTSSKFAVVSNSFGNPAVGGAAALCASVGMTLADVTSGNFQEVLGVGYDCVGVNDGAWVRSWDTNTYGLPGLELRTSAVKSASGTIVPPFSAKNPAKCQGLCGAGRTLQTLTFTGDISADGFVAGSNNAYEVQSATVGASGYQTATISSPWVTYNGFGNPADYVRAGRWDLNSLYASAAWNDGLTATFVGWRAGVQVYTKSVTLDATTVTLVQLNFKDIDRVTVSGAGGVNHGFSGSGTHVSSDNWQICV